MQNTTDHKIIIPQRVPNESPSGQSIKQPIQKTMQNQAPLGQSSQPQATQGTVEGLKAKIKSEFGVMFGADADFVISKTYSTIAQGWRFRLERLKGAIKTYFIPISKKGGLMAPGLLLCNGKDKSEMVILNQLTGKPAIVMKEDAKLRLWNIFNSEAGNAPLGCIKVSQLKDTLNFSFVWNNSENSSISIKAPMRKSGICSSPKPVTLYNIGLTGKFKSDLTFEENPNGEACMNDLEINTVYSEKKMPEMLEFIGFVCLFQAMAVELY